MTKAEQRVNSRNGWFFAKAVIRGIHRIRRGVAELPSYLNFGAGLGCSLAERATLSWPKVLANLAGSKSS